MCHGSFICVTTRSYVWHDSLPEVHNRVEKDFFILCHHSFTCVMTYSYVTWLSHMCDMTHYLKYTLESRRTSSDMGVRRVICEIGPNGVVMLKPGTHTCTHTHKYQHARTCRHTRAHTHTNACKRARTHTHTHTHADTHTQTHTDTHTQTQTHTHIPHTHTNTHTHRTGNYLTVFNQ